MTKTKYNLLYLNYNCADFARYNICERVSTCNLVRRKSLFYSIKLNIYQIVNNCKIFHIYLYIDITLIYNFVYILYISKIILPI